MAGRGRIDKDAIVSASVFSPAGNLHKGEKLIHSRQRKVKEPLNILIGKEGPAPGYLLQLGAVFRPEFFQMPLRVKLDNRKVSRDGASCKAVAKGMCRVGGDQQKRSFRKIRDHPDSGCNRTGGLAYTAFAPEEDQAQIGIENKIG